ncbi:MAG: alpha/beta hydrolase [Rhodothermales bacterium]|nr:alpha/beta hydrolase [Rhodothermales bacterium]
MTLSDGRALAYQTLGDPAGDPLFFFHGTPGSRLGFSQEDRIAQMPGICLVLPDRPGYGLSDPHPGRTLLDWAEDVRELADHLGYTSFLVGGESGGGPHALACAYRLADRVTKAVILSSPCPANLPGATSGAKLGSRLGLWLDRVAPGLAKRLVESYAASFKRNPDGFINMLSRRMAEPDRAMLADGAVRAAIKRDLAEAYRQGGQANAQDGRLAMANHDWGFSLREIPVPVFSWHGREDTLVSVHMAAHLALEIPCCRARIVDGLGHLLAARPSIVEQIETALRS